MSGAQGQLRRGVLGLGDAFAHSFALLSLALASSLATSVVAAIALCSAGVAQRGDAQAGALDVRIAQSPERRCCATP